jgi:hypothetical protein
MNLKLTKVFQKVPEGFIGFVEELPGANTQGGLLKKFEPIWKRRFCLPRMRTGLWQKSGFRG